MSKLKLISIVVGILVGVCLLALAGYQYWKTTAPHTQFEEVRDKLAVVERRLVLAESSPTEIVPEETLTRAQGLFSEAERSWMKGDYTNAEQLLTEAHSLIPIVLPPPSPPAPWGWVALIVVVVLAAAAAAYFGWWRRQNT